MGLRHELARYRHHFDEVVAVAACRDSLWFCDLCWPPFDFEAEQRRLIEQRDPGVIFETARRVVVIEEHNEELRYYAGGWCPDQDRIYLEAARIEAEGYELGVLRTLKGAVLFTKSYLARERPLQEIQVPREVRHREDTRRQEEDGSLIPN